MSREYNHTDVFPTVSPTPNIGMDFLNRERDLKQKAIENDNERNKIILQERERQQKRVDDYLSKKTNPYNLGKSDLVRVNDFKYKASNAIMSRNLELENERINAVSVGDFVEASRLQQAQQNLNNSGQILKDLAEGQETEYARIMDRVAKGEIHLTEELINSFSKFEKGDVQIIPDENGQLLISLGGEALGSAQDFLQSGGSLFGEEILNIDFNKLAQETASKFEKEITENYKGLTKEISKQVSRDRIDQSANLSHEEIHSMIFDLNSKGIKNKAGNDFSIKSVKDQEEALKRYRDMVEGYLAKSLQKQFDQQKSAESRQHSKDARENTLSKPTYVETTGNMHTFSPNATYEFSTKNGDHFDGTVTSITLSDNGELTVSGNGYFGEKKISKSNKTGGDKNITQNKGVVINEVSDEETESVSETQKYFGSFNETSKERVVTILNKLYAKKGKEKTYSEWVDYFNKQIQITNKNNSNNSISVSDL